MRCAAAAAAEMRSAPSIPASARSIDQLWQEMTDPPAAFPCLRARCAVHKALHCTSLHATTVHGSSRRRLPLGLCLLPYPLLVDVGRLSLCSASMHARWLHGEAAKELYSPPPSFSSSVPDPAAANGRRAPVAQCSADGRPSRTRADTAPLKKRPMN